MTSTLFGLSFICYFLATALYLTNLHVKSRNLAGYGTAMTFLGFTLQTARLVMLAGSVRFPFINAAEAMFFLAWAVAFLYLMILAKFKLSVVGALAVPLIDICLLIAYRLSISGRSVPIAQDNWLGIHIFAIILSMAAFGIAFCCAIFYLVQNKLLKSKRMKGMFRKLPPLELIDQLGHSLAVIGLVLLTLGIVTGIVGVQTDALIQRVSMLKIIVSGITWAIYVTYLIARGPMGWRGKKANWILVWGVVAIVLATGLHRFV